MGCYGPPVSSGRDRAQVCLAAQETGGSATERVLDILAWEYQLRFDALPLGLDGVQPLRLLEW